MKKILIDIYRSYRRYIRYRKTVNELTALSNRDLADLGINRCDIPFIANKSVQRRGASL